MYEILFYLMNTSFAGNYHNGIIPESCFPYQADDIIPCDAKCPDWEEKLVPILDVGYLLLNGSIEDRDMIKTQIMQTGPVVTGMYANDDFIQWGSEHRDPNDYYPYHASTFISHVIAIVGWKDDSSIGRGGYWICKNSWGTEWGYEGFFNIEYESLNIANEITWPDYDPESFDWPPIAPTINGPSRGKIGEEYEYAFATMDPDGDDDVYYYIDWGDGTQSDWLGPYESGEEVTASHTWTSRGSYEIKVKAKDVNGAESEWSDPLPISMPKTYENPLWTLIERLFEWLERTFGREILPGIFNL